MVRPRHARLRAVCDRRRPLRGPADARAARGRARRSPRTRERLWTAFPDARVQRDRRARWPTAPYVARAVQAARHPPPARSAGLAATNRFVIVHAVVYCELREERLLRDPRVLRPLRRRRAARRAPEAGHAGREGAADAARLRPAKLRGLPRHFLTGEELTAAELDALLDRAIALKAAPPSRGCSRAARSRCCSSTLDAHAHVDGGRVVEWAATRWCCARTSSSSRAGSRSATPRWCSRHAAAIGLRTGRRARSRSSPTHATSPSSTCSRRCITHARRSPT